MILIQQTDVKNVSLRHRTEIYLSEPLTQPDATGFSAAEPKAIKAAWSNFANDFLAEHSASGATVAPPKPLPDSISSQPPAVSKSARA